jgi:hypothetical protein
MVFINPLGHQTRLRSNPNNPMKNPFRLPFLATSRSTGRLCSVLCALAGAALASSAHATVTTLSFQPSPTDMYDLDHHYVYTWRIDNISITGNSVTGATLSIANISNWDTNPNVLHLHLLDTAVNTGVGSFYDSDGVPVTDLTDDFISTRYHSDPGWLVKAGTADTFLADPSFTTTGVNYTLNFTASQLQTLSAYIANGKDIAFGLDPDCHFFNDGVTFTMTLTPVPEMGALFPLVGLLAAVAFTHVLHRRRSAQMRAIELRK